MRILLSLILALVVAGCVAFGVQQEPVYLSAEEAGGYSDGVGVNYKASPTGSFIVEAEHYSQTANSLSSHRWAYHNDDYDASIAYMRVEPDARQIPADGFPVGAFFNDPQLAFQNAAKLWFNLQVDEPGDFTLWARMRTLNAEDNSLHVFFRKAGGVVQYAGPLQVCQRNAWVWTSALRDSGDPPTSCGVNGSARVSFTEPGDWQIIIAYREDGATLDRFILTRDPNWVPQGRGPQESPRFSDE